MNQLRQLMLEELRRRNFADTTVRCYLHGVAHFSRYFRRPPDQLSPEDIRKYQAMLFTKLKYSLNTVILRLAALRFFYIHVLKRDWSIAETLCPKKVRHLPGVLSQKEVARLIEAADTPFHRILLMTLYATGVAARNPPMFGTLIFSCACQRHRGFKISLFPGTSLRNSRIVALQQFQEGTTMFTTMFRYYKALEAELERNQRLVGWLSFSQFHLRGDGCGTTNLVYMDNSSALSM